MMKSLEWLEEELGRTAVISGEFKSKLIRLAQGVAGEAYENGRKKGLEEAKKCRNGCCFPPDSLECLHCGFVKG